MLKFAVISKGRFSHLKVEQMKVEVENKIWIKSKIVINFFSKKKILVFSKERIRNNLAKVGRKDFFFFSFYISCSFEGFLQTALTKRKKDVSMSI